MNYLEFDIEDFIMDDFFQKWVKAPDENSDVFWKQWILEHPEKTKDINSAIQFIQKIDFNEKWTPSERSEMWSYIKSNLENEQHTYKKLTLKRNWTWLAVACSLIILSSLGLYFYRFRTQQTTTAFGEIKKNHPQRWFCCYTKCKFIYYL